MELELGLALGPVVHHHHHHHVPENDLEPKEQIGLKNNISTNGCGLEFKNLVQRKRSFGCTHDQLSLLVWSGRQPNDGDDGLNITSFATTKAEEEEIVGWPPIKSWRRKLLHMNINGHRDERAMPNNNMNVRNSVYVKVKMEGVAIGRKIDLMLFNSYQSLTSTLITMFAKYKGSGKDNNGAYILSYLDKEGDWLLAGDVPWQIFIDSVQRMEISKQSS